MNYGVVIHVFRSSEIEPALALVKSRGPEACLVRCLRGLEDRFVGIGLLKLSVQDEMTKDHGRWSKNFIMEWLDLPTERFVYFVKIDPDTVVNKWPEKLPYGYDVMGDFRFVSGDLVWQGGFQVFSRYASWFIASDEEIDTPVKFQDVLLARIASKQASKAYSLTDIFNGFYIDQGDAKPDIYHPFKGVGAPNYYRFNPGSLVLPASRRMAPQMSYKKTNPAETVTHASALISLPNKPVRESPGIITKLTRLKAELSRWRKSGSQISPKSVRNQRRLACASCEFFNPSGNVFMGECKAPGCGCTKMKLYLLSARCMHPQGPRWAA